MKTREMMRYIGLLRGINVGGRKLIKVEELRRAIESLRFKNVRTFIQSGNVIFDSSEPNRNLLTAKIERKLLNSFSHEITVVLQTVDELKRLIRLNPFKKI